MIYKFKTSDEQENCLELEKIQDKLLISLHFWRNTPQGDIFDFESVLISQSDITELIASLTKLSNQLPDNG